MNEKPTLFTSLSPLLLDKYEISNSITVIIDVFRATSTIATALNNGATKVIPVDSVARCIELGKITQDSVTAGERDGKIVEGLEHGNSPAEYPHEFINGKTLVLTTTNGTKMLHMALERGADKVITGSFSNLSAVCDYLAQEKKNVILGCSGWKGRFNIEDTLFAGAVINRVKEHFSIHCDSSLMAENMYISNKHDILGLVKKASHWHRLSKYGLEHDMEYCISSDAANVLPLYDNGVLIAKNI